MTEITEHPKALRSANDINDWNEWIMITGADQKISTGTINALSKVMTCTVKVNMTIPAEYQKIKARFGKDGQSFDVPWIEKMLQKQ